MIGFLKFEGGLARYCSGCDRCSSARFGLCKVGLVSVLFYRSSLGLESELLWSSEFCRVCLVLSVRVVM